jgi:3-hydroxyisobutyrate dehydrogenase-like beta-hydroxyacid dehydrogenase
MAARLIDAGHRLTVWNRTRRKVDALVEAGAKAASSPAEAADGAEATITMLASPAAVEEVVFGDEGAAESLREGQLLIEMSTVGVELIESLAERLPKGVTVIDAPVRGSVPNANDGTLTILIGADEESFQGVSDLLEPLGTSLHMGPRGSGAAMKLVVNLTLGASITLLGEALTLGESLGLDPEVTWDVLEASPIAPIAKRKRAKIERASYSPNFKLDLALKDLRLVHGAAEKGDLDLKVAEACRVWLEEAQKAGWGDRDFSAVVAAILDQKRGSGPA